MRLKYLFWMFAFLALLAFLGLLAGLRSYQVFTQEELVAIVEIESPPRSSSYQFLLKMTPVAQGVAAYPQLFPMQGDQWAVAGEILKWHPWLNFVGVKNCHQLTRLNSRYLKVADELNAPKSAYDLNGGSGFLWPILYRMQKYIPFVEAVYGNAVHTLAQPQSRWGVYVTLSGYLIKPL